MITRRLPTAADRIATGSALIARRLATRTAAWVSAGRRHDLTGWRATLGCWFRIAILAGAAYIAARALRAVPALLWVLGAAWTIAAWRAGPPPEKALPEADEERAPGPDREAVLTLLRDLIGDRPGVHLKEVLAHLQAEGQGEGWKVGDLRTRLEALGIPVGKPFRLPGANPTLGVRREAVTAPSPAPTEAASTTASTAA